jgi:hypothetical protein
MENNKLSIVNPTVYENVEWVFQFNNGEPIKFAQPVNDVKELTFTLSNRSDSNIVFYDGKGNTFKIFAREKQ